MGSIPHVTKTYLHTIGPALHSVWHLAAALAMWKFNAANAEVANLTTTQQDIYKDIALAAIEKKVPNFLSNAYNSIAEYISSQSSPNFCTLL